MQLIRLLYKQAGAFLIAAVALLATGCNKLLDAGDPADKVITPQVYKTDSLAQQALIGVYISIMEDFSPFNGYITRYAGLSGDELNRTTPLDQDQPFLTNSLTQDNLSVLQIWVKIYSHVYQCNDLIEGLTGNKVITPALRDQLLGEAYFFRAFCYFYLTNLYGAVPLVTTTDYTQTARKPRTPVSTVYEKMLADLAIAQELLSDEYANNAGHRPARVRVNKQAVKALEARILLYDGQWEQAIAASTAVIQSGLYQLEEDLSKTFLYNSREAILQFMPVIPTLNTAEGSMFVPVVPNGRPAFVLCDSIVSYQEPGDKRRNWIRTVVSSGKPYHSPFKYKLNSGTPQEEYNMVLRLAEQYLIRAEAYAMQEQVQEAVNDLNIVRRRADLNNLTTITTKAGALAAIEKERYMELFAEWGHRWFDLKRWPARKSTTPSGRRIDEVMSAYRPDLWKPTAALWPIPLEEIKRNPALEPNPGYN